MPLRSEAALGLCFLRLNRKAPVQRIRSARRRIANAGQTGQENKRTASDFFFVMKRNYRKPTPKMKHAAKCVCLGYSLSDSCLQRSCLVDSMLRSWMEEKEKQEILWERKGREERESWRSGGRAPRCAFLSSLQAIIYARFRAAVHG